MILFDLGQKMMNNSSQGNRCRSSKSWSDENEIDQSNGSTFKTEEKYRCDQMILQHNNSPINYEQILLPIPTNKKYLTGFSPFPPSPSNPPFQIK